MSTPQPPSLPPTKSETAQYEDFKRYASVALLFTCPILLALPPRKLDFYTFGLSAAWLFSLNNWSLQQSGRSIMDRMVMRSPSQPLSKERLGVEGFVGAKKEEGWLWAAAANPAAAGEQNDGGIQRREVGREEKGIADSIRDQIWEVWNWGDEKKGSGGKDL